MADPIKTESKPRAEPFLDVPVEIIVSVGHAKPKISDLLELAPNGILELDRRVDDLVELYVGDKLIARGELQEIGEGDAAQLGVKITEIANRSVAG